MTYPVVMADPLVMADPVVMTDPVIMAYPLVRVEKTVQTLGHAVRLLHEGRAPVLRYRQRISLRNPHEDLCYEGHAVYDRPNQIWTVSFPPELVGVVSGVTPSHRGVRIVTYVRDEETDFIREVQVEKGTILPCVRVGWRPSLRIYTKGIEGLVVSFDVWLLKGGWVRAAL